MKNKSGKKIEVTLEQLLEAVGENEDIREVISEKDMNYEKLANRLGRAQLRAEIRQRIEKLFK